MGIWIGMCDFSCLDTFLWLREESHAKGAIEMHDLGGLYEKYEFCISHLIYYKISSTSSIICTLILPLLKSPHVCSASSAFSNGNV